MTFLSAGRRTGRIVIAAGCCWLATCGTAWADMPILFAEKGWAVGYVLVALCLLMGLIAVCIPRLRRAELKEDEPAPTPQAAKGQAAGKPASPYGQQYGQFGQQPGYGQQPAYGQQPGYGQQQRPAQKAAPRGGGGGARKSRKVVGLLGLFLGAYGVHRFYLGYSGLGAAMIAVTLVTCGAGGVWGFIDAIIIWTGGGVDTDADGNPLGP